MVTSGKRHNLGKLNGWGKLNGLIWYEGPADKATVQTSPTLRGSPIKQVVLPFEIFENDTF